MKTTWKIKCVLFVGWLLLRKFVCARKHSETDYFLEYVKSQHKSNMRECVAIAGILFAAGSFQSGSVLQFYEAGFSTPDRFPLIGKLPQAVIEAAVWEGKLGLVRSLFIRIKEQGVSSIHRDLDKIMRFFKLELDGASDIIVNYEPPLCRQFIPHAYYLVRAKACIHLELWQKAFENLRMVLSSVPADDPKRKGIELLYAECWSRAQ